MTKKEIDDFIEEMKKLSPEEVPRYLEGLRNRVKPQDWQIIEKVLLAASCCV